MKKESVLLLALFLLLLAGKVFSQNETISEEVNISEEENATMILEENKTLVTEENKTGGLKSPLVDCSTKCKDANGCVCPQTCEKAETSQGLDCGKKTIAKATPSVKEVSLCDGCLTDSNICLEIGTQKQETENGPMLYCSADKKLENAKEAGESCDNNYACLTYNCEGQVCTEKIEEKGVNFKLIIIIGIIVILLIGMVFVALKLLSSSKKIVKEETETRKEEGFEKTELNVPEYKYKYKPELDVLEKKLKESLKKIK